MIWIVAVILTVLFGAASLLLGRFTFMVIGFSLVFAALISLQRTYLADWQSVAVLAVALLCLMVGRPSWLRRGHRARTTRQDA